NARGFRHFAQVDADDVPALGFERFDEVVAPLQAAVLRIRAAARVDVAVHLAGNDDGDERLLPLGVAAVVLAGGRQLRFLRAAAAEQARRQRPAQGEV